MFFYKVYGLVFRSNIEMPQLLEATQPCEVDADIIVGKVPESVIERAKGTIGEDDGACIWFHNSKAYFYITVSEIMVEPKEGWEIKQIVPFIQGYCFAFFFRKRGMHAVHCSALRGEKGAVLISGYSGAGKSTISDFLLKDGYQLMADDVAIVKVENDRVLVYPAFPVRKMCRDALVREDYNTDELEYIDEQRDKFAVPYEGEFNENPTELYRMIVLKKQSTGRVCINRLKAGEALEEFLANLFLAGTFSYMKFPPEQMMNALGIVSRMKGMYTITRPLDSDTLDQIYAEVRAIIR
uniref:hypothetical protein n=1 Tax=Acetatifactor sp. TaxID=1872090 RepID=UPI004056B721